jgi:hypothetical protein
MLYKRAICDDDWGQFIDIDDTPIYKSQIYKKGVGASYMYKWFNETYLIIIEIPRKYTIKYNCICSTIITTFTVGSVMLCFMC